MFQVCGVRYRMYTYTSLVFGELGKKRKSLLFIFLIGFLNHIFIFAMLMLFEHAPELSNNLTYNFSRYVGECCTSYSVSFNKKS